MESRRDFIRHTSAGLAAAGALGSTATHLFAAAPAGKAKQQPPTLVVIYLRGGCDALNVLVPYTDKHYAEFRPTIAVPGPDASDSEKGLALDDRFALNPNMKGLHGLYQKGMLAPIVAVGSPHTTRSHFDAQDFMERAAPGLKYVDTGWLNRYLIETRKTSDANLRAFSLQPLLPRSLRGRYPVLARPEQKAEEAMNAFSKIYGNGQQPASTSRVRSSQPGVDSKTTIEEYGARTIAELRELTEVIDSAPASAATYPATAFGKQMSDIAKVIKSNRGLEVSALDINGFDTHYDEGPVDGALGKKLAELSDSLTAFVQDLGPRMERVLVMVMSEFGRTVRENGTYGTDHGHGGFMLALGGNVQGKKVYGKWSDLDPKNLYENRDVAVTTDFRVVFAETLQKTFAFDPIKHGMFPEYSLDSQPLEFLKPI